MEKCHDVAVILMGIYPGEMKTHINQEPCIGLFIPALFIIVPNWKHLPRLTDGSSVSGHLA